MRIIKNLEDRIRVMEIINDMRDSRENSFTRFANRFMINPNKATVKVEELMTMYVTYGYMNTVIGLLVSYCPTLKTDVVRVKGNKKAELQKKEKLAKDALKLIQWDKLNTEIYDILESKGDCYLYPYFKEGETIPRLKVLNSENMVNTLLDDFDEPRAYIYKDKIYDERIDYRTGMVTRYNETDITFVFEKGKVTSITAQKSEDGNIVKDKDGKVVLETKEMVNRMSYLDKFPLIHISANSHIGKRFSKIPAEEYIDKCLMLDQITTDIRSANKNLGFPIWVTIDGEFDDDSSKRIGGIMSLKTKKPSEDELDSKQAQLKIAEISNNLETMFKEKSELLDNLYDAVGLPSPTMMMQVGKSDSSKVFQQINSKMENKIEVYIDNIRCAFESYFEILFKENDLYDDRCDFGFTFAKPEHIVKNSPYDVELLKQLQLANGSKSIQEIAKENGDTSEQIENRIEEINEEIPYKTKDITIAKNTAKSAVENANNVNNDIEVE